MHSSVNRHPNTSDIVRSRATKEQGNALEILRESQSTHRSARQDVISEPCLILKIALGERRQDVTGTNSQIVLPV